MHAKRPSSACARREDSQRKPHREYLRKRRGAIKNGCNGGKDEKVDNQRHIHSREWGPSSHSCPAAANYLRCSRQWAAGPPFQQTATA